MRMLIHVDFPPEPFNSLVRDGTAGEKLSRILDALKPEAVYFTEHDGGRGVVLVAEVAGPAAIPAIAEPWFLTFNAEVRFRIAMTPDDLQKAGLEDLGRKWA